QEVGRERRRPREADDPFTTSSGDRFLALDGAVRDGGVPVRERDRDAEARLERRLVEAREDAPRVGRLALGEGIAAAVGPRRIEAAEVLVERRGEAQAEDHLARRERASKTEGHGLVGALQA